MKNWFLLLALLGFASASHAIDSAWTKTTTHYTVYMSTGWATMPFSPPSSVPISGTSVTSVDYRWARYNNGNTLEVVELCYSQPYSSVIGYCQNISLNQTGTTHAFDGFSARGQFWIRHTLTGGTYPAYPNGITDTVLVNFRF